MEGVIRAVGGAAGCPGGMRYAILVERRVWDGQEDEVDPAEMVVYPLVNGQPRPGSDRLTDGVTLAVRPVRLNDQQRLLQDIARTSFVVGYWRGGSPGGKRVGMLGVAPPVNGLMQGADGRQYRNIEHHEPFDLEKHYDLVAFARYALYRQSRARSASARKAGPSRAGRPGV